MKKRRQIIIFNNNYNRKAYKIGTRITRGHVAHRVGFFDEKTNIVFNDISLDIDAWLWLVKKVQSVLNISPKDAGMYVNKIYKTKLKQPQKEYIIYLTILRNTCGKLFSVVPS